MSNPVEIFRKMVEVLEGFAVVVEAYHEAGHLTSSDMLVLEAVHEQMGQIASNIREIYEVDG